MTDTYPSGFGRAEAEQAAQNRAIIATLWETNQFLHWAPLAILVASIGGYFLVGQTVFGAAVTAFMVYVLIFIVYISSIRNDEIRAMKVSFAQTRGLKFEPGVLLGGLTPDCYLRNFTASDRFSDVIIGESEAGKYSLFSVVSDIGNHGRENDQYHYINVFQLQTSKSLPSVVIDGIYASHPTWWSTFGKTPIVLEGGFSSSFKVCVNPGSESLALQLLAPDIMAILLDKQSRAVIDVNNGCIFLYYFGELDDENKLAYFFDQSLETALRMSRQFI